MYADGIVEVLLYCDLLNRNELWNKSDFIAA